MSAFSDLFDFVSGEIKAGFLAAIRDIADNVLLTQITAAIEAGDFEKVFRLLGVSPGVFRPMTAAVERAFERGAEFVAKSYPKYLQTPDGKGVFRFNIRDKGAEKWLRDKSASLVSGLTEDVRLAVRSSLESNMQEGRNPKTAALDIVGRYNSQTKRREGGIIGLTDHQETWVRSTRRQLETLDKRYLTKALRDKQFDSIVEEAIRTGKPLTRDQIDSLVARYVDRTLAYRGETISRTEGLEALMASDYESTKQVIASGAAREKDVVREWDTVGDDKVRHSHEKMNGQKRGINEPFETPSGDLLMYPHDRSLDADADEIIDCRCRVRTTIDWIGAALND